MEPENPIVAHTLKILNLLKHKYNKQVSFCWIPSHIGIRGNERADVLAKEALSKPISINDIVASDLKNKVHQLIKKKHQNVFDHLKSNKLRNIYPTIADSIVNHRKVNRYSETKLTRLIIGHTRITHSYILKNEPIPRCIGCATDFTVKHFLLECVDFAHTRGKYFRVNNLKELFVKVPSQDIIAYLREIGLLNKI